MGIMEQFSGLRALLSLYGPNSSPVCIATVALTLEKGAISFPPPELIHLVLDFT